MECKFLIDNEFDFREKHVRIVILDEEYFIATHNKKSELSNGA